VSYSIRVDVVSGTPTIKDISGTPPEGSFTIAGHNDFSQDQISLAYLDPDGNSKTASRMDYKVRSAPASTGEQPSR